MTLFNGILLADRRPDHRRADRPFLSVAGMPDAWNRS